MNKLSATVSIAIVVFALSHLQLLIGNKNIVGGKVNQPASDRSADDDSVELNNRIALAHAGGGGDVNLYSGVIRAKSSIILQSNVRVIGTGGTTIKCAATPCITQLPDTQLYRAGFERVYFVPDSGFSAGTIFSFSSIMNSDIGFITAKGFTGIGSILLDISGKGQNNIFDNIDQGSNIIFNTFHDFSTVETFRNQGVGTAIRLQGHISGDKVDQVATFNEFRNFNVFVQNSCIDIVRAADHNWFSQFLCAVINDDQHAIWLSHDASRPGKNVNAGSNRFDAIGFSAGPNVKSVTLFGGDWTNDNIGTRISTDISPIKITVQDIAHPHADCFSGQLLSGENITSSFQNTSECANDDDNIRGSRAWEDTLRVIAPEEGTTISGAALKAYRYLVFNQASRLAHITVQMPCGARDGDRFTMSAINGGIQHVSLSSCPSQPASIYGSNLGLDFGASQTFYYIKAGSSWIKIEGAATGSAAGQLLEASGVSVPLKSAAPSNVASIVLPPGVWNCSGNVNFVPESKTTQSSLAVGIGLDSSTFPPAFGSGARTELNFSIEAGLSQTLWAGTARFDLAATSNVYLLARATFAVGSESVSGFLQCSRL